MRFVAPRGVMAHGAGRFISTGLPSSHLEVSSSMRLFRNFKDCVALDELGPEIHFLKEGVICSLNSRSSDKLMYGFRVLIAKNFIDTLSERRGKE
jgi:hypothetical protein